MLPNKHNSVVTLALLLALVSVSKPAKASLIAQSDTVSPVSIPDAELNYDGENSGELNPNLGDSGEIDFDLENSGELNPEVGGSGELNSDFRDSGGVNLDLEDSGELNLDLENSGEPLSNNEIEEDPIADNEIIVQTQEDEQVEVATERNNWWWLIPLLGIPLLAVIIALGGRRRSDREPAIGNPPDYNDPNGGIGIAAPDGDGGNLSVVGTNVNTDGNLSNVVGNAGVATSRLGGTMAAGATNLVGDRRAIEDPDLDIERRSEQNTSLIAEDPDPESTSVVEIPSDSVSEFTGQETRLQVSNQPTMLQTNDEPDDSIDFILDDVAQSNVATPNSIEDSETISDEVATTSVGWVDAEQLSVPATGTVEPVDDYSSRRVSDRETEYDNAVTADEASVATEFPGDYVLEEETETFPTSEEIDLASDDESTTLDNIETTRNDAETTVEEISFTLDDESTTLDNIETARNDAETTAELDLDLTDKTPQPDTLTAKALGGTAFVLDTEEPEAELSLDREPDNIVDLRQDESEFTIDEEALEATPPEMDLSTNENVADLRPEDEATTSEQDLNFTNDAPQPEPTSENFGGTAFVLDIEEPEAELSLDREPDNIVDLRQDESEFTIDEEALEATPPEMDLSSSDENVADLRLEDEATTTGEQDLDFTNDAPQPEPTSENFGGTAFVLDTEEPEAELSLDREPDNIVDLRQDESEFTIDEEALEATPPEMDLSTDENVADLRLEDEATTTGEQDLDFTNDAPQPEPTSENFGGTAFVLDTEEPEAELSLDREPDNIVDLRQDESEFTIDEEALEATPPEMDLSSSDENVADLRLEDEATQTTSPEMDLSTDDDIPSDRTTQWGSAAIAGGALGGAAGAFFDRENTPERESIDAELVSEDTAADPDLSIGELDDEWASGSETDSEEPTTTEPDLFGEFESAAERTELADDAIANSNTDLSLEEITFDDPTTTSDLTFDEPANSGDLNLEEMTLEDIGETSDLDLEDITFDEPTTTSDLTLEEMTFDEPANSGDLNLEEMTFEDLENTSDISLEEITFDEPTTTSDLTLEEMTFDEPTNPDRSSVGDLERLTSDVSLDDLGFEEVESPEPIDNTFDPLRDNTADISSLDDNSSEDMDNISEWLESLETPRQNTEDISEWLNSLNTDEIGSEDNTNEQLEEADDVSFQFLEDLLERDSKTDRDD